MRYLFSQNFPTGQTYTYVDATITHAPDFTGLDPDTHEPWSPIKVANLKGLQKIQDIAEIRAVCTQVLGAHPEQTLAYRAGKTKVLGFFVKCVMAATRGGADAQLTQQVLCEILA